MPILTPNDWRRRFCFATRRARHYGNMLLPHLSKAALLQPFGQTLPSGEKAAASDNVGSPKLWLCFVCIQKWVKCLRFFFVVLFKSQGDHVVLPFLCLVAFIQPLCLVPLLLQPSLQEFFFRSPSLSQRLIQSFLLGTQRGQLFGLTLDGELELWKGRLQGVFPFSQSEGLFLVVGHTETDKAISGFARPLITCGSCDFKCWILGHKLIPYEEHQVVKAVS